MFRHVPACSGMFRNVPECSRMFLVPGFIDSRSAIGQSLNLESPLIWRVTQVSRFKPRGKAKIIIPSSSKKLKNKSKKSKWSRDISNLPNLVKKLQLWYIPERRDFFTSRSAEVITLFIFQIIVKIRIHHQPEVEPFINWFIREYFTPLSSCVHASKVLRPPHFASNFGCF